MTHHVKCDYSVRTENFCAKFARLLRRVLPINVLFLSQITLRIQNWRNTKLKSSNFAIAHRYLLRVVTFRTIISKFTGKKVEAELRKIDT